MAIITVSRGTYSGGRALAEALGEHLGYRVISREALLAEAAALFDASEEELESALLHRPGFLERRRLGRLHYVSCLETALARAARDDNLVYHGQAGHLLLRGVPHHLRVLVVADMEYRIAASRRRDVASREQAIRLIEEADEARDEWVNRVYGVDRDDLMLFDLVVNLERIPLPSACEIVSQLIERGFPTTAESREIVDNLALTCEVRARIGLDERIEDGRLVVFASHGQVTVEGKARTRRQAERVEELVKQIPGVVEVDCRAGF